MLPELARAGGRATAPAIPTPDMAARELDRLDRLGGRFLFHGDADYPPLLALLDDAPAVIGVLGSVACLSARAVALVGSRNASANGQRMAEQLARDLAESGLVVVSGLARGIDAAAHQGALSVPREGTTIACVAGGLDMPYPAENAGLQDRIAESGAVVAEAPMGTAPQARHFPRRNRLIAGLALGVVVVEAAPRSGSLITARLAQDGGRELFAVPGSPLDPRAQGANDLIRQGAHLTETAADVLDNLPDHPLREGLARAPLFRRGPAPSGLAEAEPDWSAAIGLSPDDRVRVQMAVLELLGPSPTSVDDLIRRCPFPAGAIAACLLDLELAGRIETRPGNRVALLSAGNIG